MPKTRIPSPARSQGSGVTPRRLKPRRTLSVGSARSNTSGRLTSIVQQYRNENMGSFTLSPLVGRRSLLTDDTDIEEPRRKSWWKKLNEDSRDVMKVLEDNNVVVETNNVVEEYIDIEILSQEKNNYTLDLPESSDSESINSIVMPQRKLFTQKESRPQKKFGQLVGTRETLAKLHKTDDPGLDNIVSAGTKELFQGNKQRTRPAFPSALLNISPNKTAADKTNEIAAPEPKGQVRNIFGQRPGNKRKNIFADFIVSESEEEIPEIQPKVFGFQKKTDLKPHGSSVSRGLQNPSPTSSITTDTELDDWNHLPSSTMNENQLENMLRGSTPIKRVKLSILSEAKESDPGTNTNTTADKTNQSNKSVSSKNKTKSSLNLKEKTLELNKSELSICKSKISQNDEGNNQGREINSYTERSKSGSSNRDISNQSQVQHKSIKDRSRSGVGIVNEKCENDGFTIQQDEAKLCEAIPDIEQGMEDADDDDDNNFTLEYEHDPVIEAETFEPNVNIINKNLPITLVSENDAKVTTRNSILEKELQLKQSEIIREIEEPEVLQENIKKQESKINNIFKKVQSSEQVVGNNDRNDMEIGIDQEEIIENDINVDDQEERHIEENKSLEQTINQLEEEMVVDPINNNGIEPSMSDNEEQNYSLAAEEENQEANTSQEVQSDSEIEKEENEEVENVSLEVQDDTEEEQNIEEADNESEEEEQNESLEVHSEMEIDQNESQEGQTQSENEDEKNESEEVQNEFEEEQNETDEDQNEIEDEENEEVQAESQDEQNESQVLNASDEEDQNESQEIQDGQIIESEGVEELNQYQENISRDQSGVEIEHSEIEIETANVSHDTTGRNRNKYQSPEAILHDKTNEIDSFSAQGRNTSVRKTKSIIKNLHIKPSLAPVRESTGFSDRTTNSSAEGSGWDSHRTTRKTLRQTFGKGFTPRKSLRALVMEKSAKRHTVYNEVVSETPNFPQANSTEFPEDSNRQDADDIAEVSNHEVSIRTRQTTLESYLKKLQKKNMEERLKMEEVVRNSLKFNVPAMDVLNPFKVPAIPARRPIKTHINSKSKQTKSSLITLDDLPPEVIEDMKYKPPKRFRPSNASWITKRLYKFLETKLEPRYDYKARVRAEKLVETLYHFAKELRRHQVAPSDAVDVLKHEMARLDIVKTHFEFNQFFHEYMPREIRIKVVPDLVNKISLPRHGVFSDIIRGNTIQG